jgi:C-terminal processing protease CtpA/Prc
MLGSMSWSAPAFGSFVLALGVSACATPVGTVGALIGQRPDGRLLIREAPPALGAANAGLRAGDEILLIDGRDVRALRSAAIHQALTGEVGRPVRLTVLRHEQVLRVTVQRTAAPPRLSEATDAKRDTE